MDVILRVVMTIGADQSADIQGVSIVIGGVQGDKVRDAAAPSELVK